MVDCISEDIDYHLVHAALWRLGDHLGRHTVTVNMKNIFGTERIPTNVYVIVSANEIRKGLITMPHLQSEFILFVDESTCTLVQN